jgi:molecular chaperone DnaJ
MNGIDKKISFTKELKCKACQGTKEAQGSKPSQCYSCKGEGIKKDPLFHKESKCNTCVGHGTLVVNPCKACKGTGVVTETFEKKVSVPRFTEHDSIIQFEHEGHHSPYLQRGEDGHLLVKVIVETDSSIRREGKNIISKHYITLTEAILGCNVTVNTVSGTETI